MNKKKNEKVILCNYYGMCDEIEFPIGHALKVTEEYTLLLRDYFGVDLVASPCLTKHVNKSQYSNIHALKYNISIKNNTIAKRISDKLKLMSNIHACLRHEGTLFFYQVDFFFFLYLYLFYKKNNRREIICLIYQQNFTGGVLEGLLQHIYGCAIKKTDGIIYTQPGNRIEHENCMWMPDFIYDERVYKEYQHKQKENKVVCVGTMNRYKELEKLIEVFSKLNIPLDIVGKFDDDQRFQQLNKNRTSNISISNTNLSSPAYMNKIATAKYCILPYDMDQYQSRTSGVLLESIYMGSIPIAPKQLLESNNLPGVGYHILNDLLTDNWVTSQIKSEQYERVYESNCIESIKKNLLNLIVTI